VETAFPFQNGPVAPATDQQTISTNVRGRWTVQVISFPATAGESPATTEYAVFFPKFVPATPRVDLRVATVIDPL